MAVSLWLILLLALIVLVFLALRRAANDRPPVVTDDLSRRVVVAIHAIRTRLEAAELRHELRRDAAQVRRDLRDQLEERRPGRR
jgi:hypothetical protein